MIKQLLAVAALCATSACSAQTNPADTANTTVTSDISTAADSVPVTFQAADKLTIFGRYYAAAHPKALILLFHQAGSSKGEYATIAPRLVKDGYSALAIDQRSGGDLFSTNETATLIGHKVDFLDAEQDLQAALDWAEQKKLPVIVWGSSYSAALVFPLAAKNAGKIKALLAFSPGEYLKDGQLVHRSAAKLSIPVFITSAKNPDEIAAAKSIFAAVPGSGNTLYVPPTAGVHASSTLIAARNPTGAAQNWQAVETFLKRVAP